ncbi:MAG: TonB family protein [Candidatus Aminicenantales bacterium]
MSAENKYDKFERDLLNASAAKKPKDETEVEKTVDDLLKNTLAGIGIDPEKRKQVLREAQETARAKVEPGKPEITKPEPPKPPPLPIPKSDVINLKPQDKSAKSETLPWHKEPPRAAPSAPPKKPEPSVFKEKAEMPFPGLKKEKTFFEDYGKEKKKSKPIVPIIIAGLVVVIAVAAFLIISGGKGKPPVNAQNAAGGVKPKEAVTGLTEPGSNPAELTGKPGPETASSLGPAGQKISETKTVAEKPGPVTEKRQPVESGGSAADSAPIMPSDATAAKVQEIKPTRTTPSDQGQKPAGQDTGGPAKPKVILGQLMPINQVDTTPVLVTRVEPVYPPLAQRMRIQGSVKINALIDETGTVIRTEVLQLSSGGTASGFEKASQDAVKRWKYKPAVKEGIYVKVWMPVQVTFNIKR